MKKRSCLCDFAVFLLIILMSGGLSGCSSTGENNKKSEDEIYVYYVNKEHTKLKAVKYRPEGTDPQSMAVNAIDRMNTTHEKEKCVVVKPEDVQILGITMKSNTLYINFASSYYDVNNVDELLYRSATVKTLTQIEGIDYVAFTIMGEGLVLDGRTIGSMTNESFVDNTTSDINSFKTVEIVAYYGDKAGTSLIPVKVEGVYDNNTSIEKTIIDQLINGPVDASYRRTVPSDLRLLSVNTGDGICYVDFDDSLITEAVGVSAEAELYSIVNSLIELSNVNKVQISINGDSNVKFRDSISLEYPFTRNLDIVSN